MSASLLLALALSGQCPGGACPAPLLAQLWTMPTVPAQAQAQISAYRTADGVTVQWSQTPFTGATFDPARRIYWKAEPKPPGPALVGDKPTNYGVDLSQEPGAHETALESTDPKIGELLTPPQSEPAPSSFPALGGWNPFKPKIEIDTTQPAWIIAGAILLGLLFVARSNAPRESE